MSTKYATPMERRCAWVEFAAAVWANKNQATTDVDRAVLLADLFLERFDMRFAEPAKAKAGEE